MLVLEFDDSTNIDECSNNMLACSESLQNKLSRKLFPFGISQRTPSFVYTYLDVKEYAQYFVTLICPLIEPQDQKTILLSQ